MSENELHKIPTMRTALVAIQELHVPYVDKSGYKTCMRCGNTWPCITRRLADQGLGGEERA